MSKLRKENKGFTLIELIIAIAMLAFLMTAVAVFMTSGITSYKSSKADMRVHNSAQETYDKLSDAVMEAKEVYLFGYLEGDDKLYCFVKDDEQKKNINNVRKMVGKTDIGDLSVSVSARTFDDGLIDSNTKVYIAALVIDTSAPITEDDLTNGGLQLGGLTGTYKNVLTGEDVVIKKAIREKNVAGTKVFEDIVDEDGNAVINEKDTIRQMYVFEDTTLYYMTKYAFCTNKNDNYVDNGGDMKNYLYSTSFDIIDDSSAKRTAAIAYVDADNGAIAIDLFYEDKKMTYTTNGMIKIRNSFVLKAKK